MPAPRNKKKAECERRMDLIPCSAPDTGNYFCTWDSQCDHINTMKDRPEGFTSRDAMCEEFLFGKNGVLESFDGVRGDLIVVLDDGWDVPYRAKDTRVFGSLEADPERFPSLRGLPPAARLKKLSERVRAMGYRGLGLWVPTQTPSLVNGREIARTPDEERLYWEERARWCGEAGIVYIKADWGAHQGDADYCAMMTRCMRKYAPGVIMEHGLTGRPLFETEENGHAVPEGVRNYLRKVLPFCDRLRTYDVVHELKYASTVDRAAICLETARSVPESDAALNIEDTALIGAALGCSIGVMRHELEKKRKYLPLPPRPVSDSVRALRWQRIAPPFAAGGTPLEISSERLKDVWHCPERAPGFWPDVKKGDYYVTAPAAIARNMPLPEVTAEGEKPYVLCSVHPENGALCVAATPRAVGGELYAALPARVTVRGRSADAPIGVFGSFDSLTVLFDGPVGDRRVYAQDLNSGEALDVTDNVTLDGRGLTVPGGLLTRIGQPEEPGDAIPAVVIGLKV